MIEIKYDSGDFSKAWKEIEKEFWKKAKDKLLNKIRHCALELICKECTVGEQQGFTLNINNGTPIKIDKRRDILEVLERDGLIELEVRSGKFLVTMKKGAQSFLERGGYSS